MKERIVSMLPPGKPWGELVHCYDTVDSTNTLAKQLALKGAPHGTVLIAESQTGGRGRRGRSFHSPAGTGIYMSILLRPECRAEELMHLTCAAAVALHAAVEKTTGLNTGIKWTNDLVCGKRKLAGILTELLFGPDGSVSGAVVGIGINCNQTPEDFPSGIQQIAGSLAMAAGAPVDRAAVAAAMIEAFCELDLKNRADIMVSYRCRSITLGKEVSLDRADGAVRHGKALDVDDSGALVVAFEDGKTEAVNSGEVSVRGMYGYL